MLSTDKITQSCNGSGGSVEVSELPFAVKCNGVPIDVIVNMGFIGMSANKESVFSFEKAGGEIISDLICFLRCYFPRLERLAYLINEHIVLFLFAGIELVLPF